MYYFIIQKCFMGYINLFYLNLIKCDQSQTWMQHQNFILYNSLEYYQYILPVRFLNRKNFIMPCLIFLKMRNRCINFISMCHGLGKAPDIDV